tara:strand:+ start:4428 stop:4793 length:366 start_codon:yes stop_codon:yes gene_type:complete
MGEKAIKMDIWSLIETEKALEGKTLDEFKQWVKDEIAKEDRQMTEHYKQMEQSNTTYDKAERRYLRAKQIAKKYSIAVSTVWYWVSIGKLPQPDAKLGARCTVWLEENIDKAMEKIMKEGK